MRAKSKQGERQRPFFIYGSLLPGQPNEYLRPGKGVLVRAATLRDGRSLTVWVYLGPAELVNGRSLVADGDWAAYIAVKREGSSHRLADIGVIYGLHDPFAS